MDKNHNFDSPIFTSTPLNQSFKKRQLVRDNINKSQSFSSPAHKNMKVPSNLDESDVTMQDLFAFDDGNEKDEQQSSKESSETNLIIGSSTETGTRSQSANRRSSSHDSFVEDSQKSNQKNANASTLSIKEDTNISIKSNEKIEIVEDSFEQQLEQSLVIIEDSSVPPPDLESNKIPSEEKVKKIEENFPIEENNDVTEAVNKNARGPIIISPPMLQQHLPLQLKRLFGGHMSDGRMDKIHGITNDMITAMHTSLSSIPENIPTEPPKGLRIDLMPHQKAGLTWLIWREQQIPPSGILADDMGLGKTLAMISLILYKKNARKEEGNVLAEYEDRLRRHYIQDRNLISSNATLVIAPASLIFQWEKEVRDRVKDDKLKVLVFHGPKNKRDISAYRLAKYDMVITTYDILVNELKRPKLIGQSESDDNDDENEEPGGSKSKSKSKYLLGNKSSVLEKIAWERIIIDEAHEIRNKDSQKSRSCCRIEAVHRWALTGTPIHNKLMDFYALIRFMRITPFNEEKIWKVFIENQSKKSSERLNTIVKSILLRRTKNQICSETNRPLVDLKPKTFELVTLELKEPEQHCYSIMFQVIKEKVTSLIRENEINERGFSRRKINTEKIKNPFIGDSGRPRADNKFQLYSCLLVFLLRLRQACVHMALTRKAVDLDAFKEDGAEGADQEQENVENMLEESFSQLSLAKNELLETGQKDVDARNREIDDIFKQDYRSAKVEAILERLEPIIANGDKCVIVSQWSSMLEIIEYHIRLKGVRYTSITGNVRTDDRQSRIDSFNKTGSGPAVMLLSLTAGGVGLNLIGGNHLFMVDLHWNPALELQACDRIYRLGQRKDVFIHKFICKSTIEQRVLELQEKKTALAKSVLEGAASRKLTKLTKDELMFLFELDKRPNAAASKPEVGKTSQQQPTTSSQAEGSNTNRGFMPVSSMLNYGGGLS